jgi:hypothetical protein
LQTQVVVSRWLQARGSNEISYPRFQAVRGALQGALAALGDAYTGDLPPIAVVNMSYVNIVPIPHATPVVERYFSPSAHLQIAQGAQQMFKVEASWKESAGIDLRYSLEQVHAIVADEKVEAYSLTTAAGSRVAPNEDGWLRLDYIHDRMQEFFSDLLSEQAKKEWQLTPVSLD